MKSHNFKKTLSTSMASLTVLSSLSGLSSARINAAPKATEVKTNACNENEIEFTFTDFINIGDYYFISKDTKNLVNHTPNLLNLLAIDKDLKHWQKAMAFFFQEIAKSICKEQSENLSLKDMEGLSSRYIPIGDSLNNIRLVLNEDESVIRNISQAEAARFMLKCFGISKDVQFNKLTEILKIRKILTSVMKKLVQSYPCSIPLMQDLKKEIKNSKEISSKLGDPTVEEMVNATLEAIDAKETLLKAKIKEFDMLGKKISEIKNLTNDSCPEKKHEQELAEKEEVKNLIKTSKKDYSRKIENFNILVDELPGKILMERVLKFDKRECLKKENKTIAKKRPQSLKERIDFFENISKTQTSTPEPTTYTSKSIEKAKSNLIKMVKSANSETFEKTEKTIKEIQENAINREVKKIAETALAAMEAKQALLTAEISACMVDDLKKESTETLKKLENSKNESEEWKKEYEAAQEKQKDIHEKEAMANANKQNAEKDFLKAMEKLNEEKTCFTFRDLEELMSKEKSQEKIESTIAEVCNFDNTNINQDIWDHSFNEFDKSCNFLLEGCAQEERAILITRIKDLPIAAVSKRFREILLNRYPEIEYLKATCQLLNVILKEPSQENKQNSAKTASEEAPAQNNNSENSKPAQTEEKTTAPAETHKKIENQNIASCSTPAKTAEKSELPNENSKKENIIQTKKEEPKKKSFWSTILDFFEKLPLIGRFIRFLRK